MDEAISEWVGREEVRTDAIDPARSNALQAALGRPAEAIGAGDALPLLHHWLYFWDVPPPERTGVDGHPARGEFLPPIAAPRRMWASGSLVFHAPLKAGESASRVSTIRSIETKTGRSGTLVFVTVDHEISSGGRPAISEEQVLVYREAGKGGAPLPEASNPPDRPWCETIMPDPVLLFRYSALTMNSHRIHYDSPYATQQEGYPGLVVHGPLQATLLADLARRHCDAPLASFAFRGQAPAFAGVPLHLCGAPGERGGELETRQGETVAMAARYAT